MCFFGTVHFVNLLFFSSPMEITQARRKEMAVREPDHRDYHDPMALGAVKQCLTQGMDMERYVHIDRSSACNRQEERAHPRIFTLVYQEHCVLPFYRV